MLTDSRLLQRSYVLTIFSFLTLFLGLPACAAFVAVPALAQAPEEEAEPVTEEEPPPAAEGTAPAPTEGSERYCNNCKRVEQNPCKIECKAVDGVKFFVCVNKCTTKRCTLACSAPEPETPSEEQIKKEFRKKCGQCKRQAGGTCKNSCAAKPSRERSGCKKLCLNQTCRDACTRPEESADAPEADAGSDQPEGPEGEAAEESNPPAEDINQPPQ